MLGCASMACREEEWSVKTLMRAQLGDGEQRRLLLSLALSLFALAHALVVGFMVR